MTLEADDVIPLVLAACPSFRPEWEDDVEDQYADDDGPRLHYLDAAAVARHVVGLVGAGSTDELPALFAVIERLHLEGTAYVTELATIGYLEDLQNSGDRAGIAEEVWLALLGPESRRWWRGLRAFWEGRAPRVLPIDD